MSLSPAGTQNVSYAQDMAIVRTKTQWILLVFLLILLGVLPLIITSDLLLSIINVMPITIISVHGLNLLTGYSGQISLGQAAFMMVGGYTAAILVTRLGLSFWASLPLAGLGAAIVGLVFALPAVRVKGFYLAMTTVVAQFVITYFVVSLRDITGGVDGLQVPAPSLGGFIFDSEMKFYYISMPLAVIGTIIAKNLVRTRVGRAFIAVRDNDLAASVMGINLFAYKLLAFFIGSFFAGIAGALLSFHLGIAHTYSFTLIDSVWYLGMVIVGGMGSCSGVIFGVVSLRALSELITIYAPTLGAHIPALGARGLEAALGLMFQGLVIMLFLIHEPRGLAHRWEVLKSQYRLWPFSY